MGNCTDACANKGEQEEVLAGAKNKEAGYMVGAANQGDLDVPSTHQNILGQDDQAKPTFEKPGSFNEQLGQGTKMNGSHEPEVYYPMFNHQSDNHVAADNQPPQPAHLPESSFHKSRVDPAAVSPDRHGHPAGSSNLIRSEQKLQEQLNQSLAGDKRSEKPVAQQSSLQQSQRLLGSNQQLPPQSPRDARPEPAQPAQQTPQSLEFQYRDGFFSGEAEKGLPHGQGSFTNGNYSYSGAWVQGLMHGKCTVEE